MRQILAGVAAASCSLAAAACGFKPVPAGGPPPPYVVSRDLPAQMVAVGRGVVSATRSTGLALYRGRDGRRYALTGTFGNCRRCTGDRVLVWDVTDPAHPVRTDSVAVDARIVNDVAVNAAGTLAVATREMAGNQRNGIAVLDLADPAHPRLVSDYWETITGGAHSVVLDGSHAYLADNGSGGVVVLDLSDPRDPRPAGRWSLPPHPGIFLDRVFVKDGLAYLAYWNDGLVVLDVGRGIKGGTPARPVPVGQFRYRSEWHGERYGNTHVAFPYTNAAGRAYVFVGDEILPPAADLNKRFATGGYVHVIDASQPAALREVATYDVPEGGVHSLWVAGDTMYVAAYGAGVHAVDVSGELRGSLRRREIAAMVTSADSATAFLPDLPMAWSVIPQEGHVFITDFNSGLWVARVRPKP